MVPTAHLTELTVRLEGLIPAGFAIEEPYVPLGPEEGARLEAWRPTVVKLYLPSDETLDERRRKLEGEVASLLFHVELHERRVLEEDWAESWKQFFQVERVSERIVIRPTWRDYEPLAEEIVLDLDPGMAFGTGQHPTTRMCLIALEKYVRPGLRALDLGCGSGILSLAAVKLGCAAVLALDVESIAIVATRANAELNGVSELIRAERGSLGDRWPLPDKPADFDIVVANISAAALVALAVEVAAALRPGGCFIGSGVIGERLDEVLVALAAAGIASEQILAEGDWRALAGRRPAEPRERR